MPYWKMALWRPIMMAALAVPAAPPLAAEGESEPGLTLQVNPRIVLADQDVMAVVVVARDDDNRRLTISIDAPSFYAETERQLDGESAARVHEFPYKQLPPGDYVIVARVEHRSGSDDTVEARFSVRGEPLEELAPVPGRKSKLW